MTLTERPIRIGILGYGQIGRSLAQRIREHDRLDLAFVFNRTGSVIDDLSPNLVLDNLTAFESYDPDLIVEASHPIHVREHGASILHVADFLPLSTSALVDDALRAELALVAEAHNRRLILPHGALVGLDALVASNHMWESVAVTFIKHPAQIETAEGVAPTLVDRELLFEGSVRDIAPRFPRNVNSMVTLALATVGLDRCTARLVADPEATKGVLDIEARGRDSSVVRIRREQPMTGVSGTEMFDSLWASLSTATGLTAPGICFA